jgi:catechol 2,3-dioxygenase-like lactoylglutathione lyase family enzyme
MLTRGVHHIGLTVPDVEETAAFFTGLLGWDVVGGNEAYPAVFVSDGVVMVTVWQVRDAGDIRAFDKDRNVGLHHLALRVADLETLQSLHHMLRDAGIPIEFAPEPLRDGPAMHMMCFEPGGNRIEFIVPA